MARTYVPPCPPPEADVNPQEVLDTAYGLYASNVADMDKSGTVEDHNYYAGAADAYRAIILKMTGVDLIKED